jgi:hypothetical protein
MKKYLLLLPVLLFFACNTANVQKEVPSTVGFFNYGPAAAKILEARKAEGNEEPFTQEEVLSLITQVKNELEASGLTVIGIEAQQSRIWFKKPM